MRVVVKGKNLVLTEPLERYALEKFGRLIRYRPRLDRIVVELSLEATRGVEDHFIVDANVLEDGAFLLRGSRRAATMQVAIDELVEVLERQLHELKDRQESSRRLTAPVVEAPMTAAGSEKAPPPPEAGEIPSPLARMLSLYDVNEEAIEYLEKCGVLTVAQLRDIREDGRLAELLGPLFRHQLRKIEHALDLMREVG
ncbi:MAG: ribosome-associated translation inhibitor RaiA [Chloroflexi bacterium]|nr:ribosome-associated translation inhibitor RaiA [Chloroflexota bacterium]